MWWRLVADKPDIDPERLEADVVAGLDQGDLGPLAEYLRRGLPLTTELRSSIINTIEPTYSDWPDYLLTMKKRRRGVGNEFSKVERFERQLRIARFVDAQLLALHGNLKEAVFAAEQHFQVKRSTVMEARRIVKIREKETEALS